jgi:fructose-1,6-bisphosphatase-3
MAHPEYHLEHRLLLDKIDYEKGTIKLPIGEYELLDKHFPTIDPADPYKLTPEEEAMLDALEPGFTKNDKLQRHIKFLFTHGALYTVVNGNLLYHGCIPMNEDGSCKE